MNSDSDYKLPMTDEEVEMVGEPLYDCFIPTADAQDEHHQSDIDNDVSKSQEHCNTVHSLAQCRLSAPPGCLVLP